MKPITFMKILSILFGLVLIPNTIGIWDIKIMQMQGSTNLYDEPQSWTYVILQTSIMVTLFIWPIFYRKRDYTDFLKKRGNFSKDDFLKALEENNIPENIGLPFVEFLNKRMVHKQMLYPQLNDSRYVWDIDDDSEDYICHIFEKNGKKTDIRWNDKRVLELETIGDLLVFIRNALQQEEKHGLNTAG